MINIIEYLKKCLTTLLEINQTKKNKAGLQTFYGTSRTYSVTVTPGSNYSSASGSAVLCGNILRVYGYATRKTALSAGNNTNETMCTLSFPNTGGYIRGNYNNAGLTGGTGGVANFYPTLTATDSTVTVAIKIVASHGGIAAKGSINCYMAIPVALKGSAFA
jgi:hypothetical protein